MSSGFANLFSSAGCFAAGDLHTSLTIREPSVPEDSVRQKAATRALSILCDQTLPMGHRIAARIDLLISDIMNPSPLYNGPMPEQEVKNIHAIIAAYRSGELDGHTTTWWRNGEQIDEPPMETYNPKKDKEFVPSPPHHCEAAIDRPPGFQLFKFCNQIDSSGMS